MKEFVSNDEFEIKGRGKVFTMKSPEEIHYSDLMGKEIKINGIVYKCKGIERYPIHTHKECVYKGESIGLLVCEV